MSKLKQALLCPGLLVPLGIVLGLGVPIFLTTTYNLSGWQLWLSGAACVMLPSTVLAMDAIYLAKRSKEKDFNPWSEI